MATNKKLEKKPKVDLRDYFLAAAIKGLCANPVVFAEPDWAATVPQLVRLAVKITDEVMLKGR